MEKLIFKSIIDFSNLKYHLTKKGIIHSRPESMNIANSINFSDENVFDETR